MSDSNVGPAEVLRFWQQAGPERWFEKNTAFDEDIRRRFLTAYEAAAAGKFASWESTAEGALALVIMLDQFPRNMFRGQARAFASDPLALATTARAIMQGFDAQVPASLRSFFYLPFEHSENPADQQHCMALFRAAGDADGLKWAQLHADIIQKFGRFPHRNAVLGRITSPEEQAFLDAGGFSG